MALGEPLLSIIRNAAEWLADSKDNVTLLLSPTLNVFNGDTECYYFAVIIQTTCSVALLYSEIPSFITQNT